MKILQPLLISLAAILITLSSLNLLSPHAAPLEARTINNVVVNYAPETITVTDTQTITPSKSFLAINNGGGWLTMTLSAGGALEGDYLLIASEVTTNTTLATTNTSLTTTDIFSQNDVLEFIFTNSQWVLVSSIDNAAD